MHGMVAWGKPLLVAMATARQGGGGGTGRLLLGLCTIIVPGADDEQNAGIGQECRYHGDFISVQL